MERKGNPANKTEVAKNKTDVAKNKTDVAKNKTDAPTISNKSVSTGAYQYDHVYLRSTVSFRNKCRNVTEAADKGNSPDNSPELNLGNEPIMAKKCRWPLLEKKAKVRQYLNSAQTRLQRKGNKAEKRSTFTTTTTTAGTGPGVRGGYRQEVISANKKTADAYKNDFTSKQVYEMSRRNDSPGLSQVSRHQDTPGLSNGSDNSQAQTVKQEGTTPPSGSKSHSINKAQRCATSNGEDQNRSRPILYKLDHSTATIGQHIPTRPSIAMATHEMELAESCLQPEADAKKSLSRKSYGSINGKLQQSSRSGQPLNLSPNRSPYHSSNRSLSRSRILSPKFTPSRSPKRFLNQSPNHSPDHSPNQSPNISNRRPTTKVERDKSPSEVEPLFDTKLPVLVQRDGTPKAKPHAIARQKKSNTAPNLPTAKNNEPKTPVKASGSKKRKTDENRQLFKRQLDMLVDFQLEVSCEMSRLYNKFTNFLEKKSMMEGTVLNGGYDFDYGTGYSFDATGLDRAAREQNWHSRSLFDDGGLKNHQLGEYSPNVAVLQKRLYSGNVEEANGLRGWDQIPSIHGAKENVHPRDVELLNGYPGSEPGMSTHAARFSGVGFRNAFPAATKRGGFLSSYLGSIQYFVVFGTFIFQIFIQLVFS